MQVSMQPLNTYKGQHLTGIFLQMASERLVHGSHMLQVHTQVSLLLHQLVTASTGRSETKAVTLLSPPAQFSLHSGCLLPPLTNSAGDHQRSAL